MEIKELRKEINNCDTFEDILEIIINDLYTSEVIEFYYKNKESNGVSNGCKGYSKRNTNLNNPIRNTFNSIRAKIIKRNRKLDSNDYYFEDDKESLEFLALVQFLEVLKDCYDGKVKMNKCKIDTNANQLEQFKQLFNEDNILIFMSILYNRTVNNDFNNNVKKNTYNQHNILLKGGIFKNLQFNLSFDTTVENDDGEVPIENILYLQNQNIKEKYFTVEELNKNSTNICEILVKYKHILTTRQQQFLRHMEQLMTLRNINLWADDMEYSSESKAQYKRYIKTSYFKSIEEGEIPCLKIHHFNNEDYIIQVSNFNLDEFFNQLKSITNYKKRFDFLDNQLKLDTKLTELIVDLLLDYDVYKHYMRCKKGEISINKFVVLYLNPFLKEVKNSNDY